MKVNKTRRTGRTESGKGPKKPEAKPRITFSEILSQMDDQGRSKELLEQLLDDIREKGDALVENRTVETLAEYKNMIRSFIDEAVHEGLKIDEHRGISRTGRSRVIRTVKEIDKRLLELTNIILGQEKKQIRILQKVGQIQGLLVDLIL